MTNMRAAAYSRVLKTLRDLGPAKLLAAEQACIREAADGLLFCGDVNGDRDARAAFGAVVRLADDLVLSERWTVASVQMLLDDIWACGPAALVALPVAA
jgi:hypothetical protein